MQGIDKTKQISVARLVIILGALSTFGPFGTDTYLAAFGAIAESYSTSVGNVQLSLSVYFLGLALGQLIYGPLVDHFGRRKPLMFGLSLFALSSFLIVVAPNIECFLLLRVGQALGGCAGMIVSRAVVRDMFNLSESARVLSLLAVVQGLGPILAPVIGGVILSYWPWRAVFVFIGSFGIGCLALSGLGLPESLPREKRLPLNLGGVFRDYASLMMRRDFIIPAMSGGMASSCLFAYISGSPYVFMHIYGASPAQYSLIFATNAVGTILAAQLNRVLLRRFIPQQVLSGAIMFSLASSIALILLSSSSSMYMFMVPLWLCIATIPMIVANSVAIAMDKCPDKAGSASAIVGLFQFALGSVSSALVGILNDGSAYPMSVTMFVMVLAGFVTGRFTRRAKAV
ncbi:MAG: multidrug effflux MFS transporter [Opitutales bacterium]|nr:multidrug effflux MFS transporter [Opitutales bacterium]